MLSGELLNQRHVVIALIVGTLAELLLHTRYAVGHLLDVGEGLLSLLTHRGVVLQNHNLRQIAYGALAGHAHGACRGLLHATQDLEHRRFAGTILTDKGNTVFVVDDKGRIAKQGFYAKLYF